MRLTLACLTLAAAGCTAFITPYQPMGLMRGGYTDSRLDDSTYVIDVQVTQPTGPAKALTYFSRRATEVCAARGYHDFAVLEERATVREDGSPEHYGRVRCR